MLPTDTAKATGPILMVVAAALIDEAGHVLVQQRPPGKPMAELWEFPGGKVDPGELPETALARELDEELGIAVDPAALVPAAFASETLGNRHLLLLLYTLRHWGGQPQARHATALAWVRPPDLRRLAMPPADKPLIDLLDAVLQAAIAPADPRVRHSE